jgi:hypothetical protein
MTPVVINELAGYPLVKDSSSVPLTKLRELFGNGKKTKLAHIRDGRLMPLATELGLLEGEKMKDGYKIKIGYLGWVFYEKVYTPIVDETDVAFNRSIT